MHFEFLLEEPSAEIVLNTILTKILAERATYNTHSYQGKQDLPAKLPSRLRGYRAWMPKDWYVVILVDRDDDDCRQLKKQLEDVSRVSGFHTKSSPDANGRFNIINRIAIEELEAWFFGDVPALRQAYERISSHLATQSKYRETDAVKGGTAEALERLLVRHKYYSHSSGMPKLEVARKISVHMNPFNNRSPSFQQFRQALLTVLSSN